MSKRGLKKSNEKKKMAKKTLELEKLYRRVTDNFAQFTYNQNYMQSIPDLNENSGYQLLALLAKKELTDYYDKKKQRKS